jgi:hypothetical protein
MDIYDLRKATSNRWYKVFEGSVGTSGEEDDFSPVSSCLITALFEDFPGESGGTQTVAVSAGECVR